MTSRNYKGDTCKKCEKPITIRSESGYCQSCYERSPSFRKKIGLSRMGSKNPMWKGDDIGYGGKHYRLKTQLKKPERCERCKITPPHDLANRSGKYLLDLSDWWYLCRRCHMKIDGRMKNLRQYT